MKPSVQLLRGLKGEERERYTEYLVHNKELLDRVIALAEQELQTSVKAMRDPETYELPAWSQFQADQLGYQRAMAKVVAWLTLDREEKR